MAVRPETFDLTQRARAAVMRGDGRGALELLRPIAAAEMTPEILLDKALALRIVGDLAASVEALDAVLVLDPRNFLALLSKGALFERLGQAKAAVVVYRNALALAPPDWDLPAGLAAPVARAREAVRVDAEELAKHLRASVAPLREALAAEALDRFDESLGIYSGLTRAYVQEPMLLHYPRLPAIPFWDRGEFPWLEDLEAATADISAEALAVMNDSEGGLEPYIVYPPGTPVNQWGELNHSRRWSSFFLWRDGKKQASACARCPRTSAVLDTLPLAQQPAFAPTVVFSVLEARTHIPPHTGSVNSRLLVHLPLVLPGPARFRVGNVTRDWRLGEAWVFDDTIEHEAWNDADEPRAILILDIWNPLLSQAERELISVMMTAKNAFQVG